MLAISMGPSASVSFAVMFVSVTAVSVAVDPLSSFAIGKMLGQGSEGELSVCSTVMV